MSDTEEVLPSGARQSKVQGRFDLLWFEPMRHVAAVREFGAEKYGPYNHRGITVADNLNHAIQHIYRFIEGHPSEHALLTDEPIEHLAHAVCRILMAMDNLLTQEADANAQSARGAV